MLRTHYLLIFIVCGIVLYGIYYFFYPTATAPWADSGRLVLAVRSVPGPAADSIMTLGIDNMQLYKKDGAATQVTVLTRRITLTPGSSKLELVLDDNTPVGDYTGFGFVLKSPEIRNAWQGEDAPVSVLLAGDNVRLDTSYSIKEDETTAIILGFETLQAVHEKDSTHTYLPVVQIETRTDVTVSVDEKGTHVEGGTIQGSATFGMDWDGRMRYNFRARTQ